MSRETFLDGGFPSRDSLRDMEPRPTPPEDESLGIPNTETVLISSNSETATKLCGVCSSIPAWFWTQELEVDEKITIELQPFKEMKAEAQNGCGLCQVLCVGDWYQVKPPVRFPGISILLELGRGRLVKRGRAEGTPKFVITCRFGEVHVAYVSLFSIPSACRLRSPTAADETSNLLLMQDWIDNCRLNHISCNNVIKDFLPTRLLDLEAFNKRSPDLKDDIKLVLSASHQFQKAGSLPHYITLSHCWGPPEKRPVTTTLANLAGRMGRIAFADLPRTFQDAVVLTRKLGQRYLWIDSLCIIQDDEDDWANEASMMAKVYTQSYCTLAALSSSDSTEGLRMSGNGRNGLIIDLSANNAHHGLFNARIFSEWPTTWQHEYDGFSNPGDHFDTNSYQKESPLRYRAWALQEKELSTRSIHFGFKQLLWECREFKGTSELPWYPGTNHSEIERQTERKRAETHPEDSILYYRMSVRWLKLCEDYSRRYLTNDTDKLPALSGIAQSFQKYFPNDRYIAGIWSSHFLLALLWQRWMWDRKWYTEEYIAPSWSWTSSPSAITYDHFDYDEIFWQKVSKTSDSVWKWFDEPEVVNITGQPKLGDDYGALKKGATLDLRGQLLELDSDLVRELDGHVRFYKNGVFVATFKPDVYGPFQGKFVCLGMFNSVKRHVAKGLILKEHIHDGSPVYSRVGVVYLSEPSSHFWDDSERRQITLI